MAEASVDIIRSSARVMLASVMYRRALWLKADAASKSNYCKIPYDETKLFGSKLDLGISKVTSGKSGLIPLDKGQNNKEHHLSDAISQKDIGNQSLIDQGRNYIVT